MESGKLADLIVIDHDSTVMTPFYDVYSTLVYAASARDVKTTIIDGRVVMQDGNMLTVDAVDVRQHVRELGREDHHRGRPRPEVGEVFHQAFTVPAWRP